uniref:Ig-like domain-containing protein n=1 Tax=Anolis carolinensis TaxID=28377 RepID=A0A803TXC4_ANOCA
MHFHSEARSLQTCFLLLGYGILLSNSEISQDLLVEGSDGKELNLSCKLPSASKGDAIHWYRQFPSQVPHFIVSGYNGKVKSDQVEGVFLFIQKDQQSSILSFTGVTLEDSASYYCAVSDTVLRSGVFAMQKLFPSD